MLEPATDYFITDIKGAVRIRQEETSDEFSNLDPVAVPTFLKHTARRLPEKVALSVERDGSWKEWSYREYLEDVETCAKALIHLGLEEIGTVGILGYNAPEWFIGYMGTIFARGISVGIYPTNSSDACFYCLHHSKASILFVEDDYQLQKISSLRSKLPHLKAIIQYTGKPTEDEVLEWSELMRIGAEQSSLMLETRMWNIRSNQCCSLIYTSGTTGMQKAVMVSHDNLTWVVRISVDLVGMVRNDDKAVIVSYLPLSHVAAQALDIVTSTYCATTVYFADKDALKGTLVKTLRHARPTSFLAVPRVWEKFYANLPHVTSQSEEKGENSCPKKLENMKIDCHAKCDTKMSQILMEKIGLDKTDKFFTCTAPLSLRFFNYFVGIGINISEIYGLSECSGPHTCSLGCGENRFDKCGKAMYAGMKTKVKNPTDDDSGEISIWGRHVFMGYLNDEKATRNATNAEGWFHTGDVGTVDHEGYLQITGRIKEILITSGGENIPSPLIEMLIKEELPCISHAVLIGDKRNYLTVLLTIKTNVSDKGVPLDAFTPEVLKWLKDIGSDAQNICELLNYNDDNVNKAIEEGILRVNSKAISNAQKVQKWAILSKDFSLPGGELGPTLKLLRQCVLEKYSDVIEALYTK